MNEVTDSATDLLAAAREALAEACRSHDRAGNALVKAEAAQRDLQERFGNFISALQGKEAAK